MAYADYQAKLDQQAKANAAAASKPASAPPPPATANPPPPAASSAAAPDDGGWLHWLATKGMGQDYQRSLEKGMTLGLGDLITGGIMGAGKAAVTGDSSAISDEIARQRADTAAARERIGPVGQAATDIASQFMPAQRLLGASRWFGPTLQGGVQSATNAYGEGDDWATIRNKGLTGAATGAASTIFDPTLARGVIKYGPPAAAMSTAGHAIMPGLGEWIGGAISPFVGNEKLDKLTDWVADKGAGFLSNPAARQAIQNVVIGGGQTTQGTGVGNTAAQNLWNALPSASLSNAGTALQNLRGLLPF